jgi:PAS domain S-box-containing protein
VNLRDVTIRVETEEQLVRARVDFRNVIEQAPDGVVVRRGDVVAYANPAFARSLGIGDPASLVGQRLSTLVVDADRDRAIARLNSGVGGERHEEYTLRTAAGEPCHLEISPAQNVQFDGQAAKLVITRDVTERKKMQTQLMVSDRMASVGTLAAGVAHEINNPLATVLANVDLALRDVHDVGVRPGARDELLEELQDAREGVERVRQIARDLKVFSRGDEEVRGPVDVRRALESSLRMGWNEIRHRARLVKDFAPVPPVDANESRLGQVFLNLVVNAAQAIPEGQSDRNEIRVKTYTDAQGRAVIEVVDTGPGIPADVMKRLFTPFFTTKPIGQGTGLGLSICQRIITALDGEITLSSELGHGTTARVVLPAAKVPATAAAEEHAAAKRAGRRGQILVIDDEPMVALAVRRTLQGEHDVTICHSATEALRLIDSGLKFDVILCDLMMPQVTGIDFFHTLSQRAPEQAARTIFLTGGAFTPRARAFLDETTNQRLEKPFDPQNLRAVVNHSVV